MTSTVPNTPIPTTIGFEDIFDKRMLQLNNLLASLQDSIDHFSDTGVFFRNNFDALFKILTRILIRHAVTCWKCQVINYHEDREKGCF